MGLLSVTGNTFVGEQACTRMKIMNNNKTAGAFKGSFITGSSEQNGGRLAPPTI
jgi:hypothetical protein